MLIERPPCSNHSGDEIVAGRWVEPMRIVGVEVEVDGASREHLSSLATAEAARLWELVQLGVVRETHFRSDRNEAVLILECADLDAARAHVDSLPYVRAGLIQFELIGLRPYPGFARLFGQGPAGSGS